MKHHISMLFLCLLSVATMQAQSHINGRVFDARSNEPLPFATIAVLAADSTVLTGTVADGEGNFSLDNKSTKGSLLSFSCIGYATLFQPLQSAQSPLEVRIQPSATTLEAVQITAKAPVVEQQMDKLVMNVAQSAFAQGNNAEDLLRKAPGVSIDKDGNVQLNGQAVAVWIDGRPSQLDGKNLQALLRSTDGTTIDKIEVIANPSAKYDAEGQGGIINIRTKRNFKQGFNGSLSANAGGMFYHRNLEMTDPVNEFFFDQEASLNLNYRGTKTNTFLQVSESTNQLGVDVVSATDLASQAIDFYQKSVSRYNARWSTVALKLGNDWFIDKRNTIGVILTLPMNYMSQTADTNGNRSFQRALGSVSQQTMSFAQSNFRFSQYMGNLNYTHVFNEARQAEITANLDYMHFINQSSNPLDNYLLTPSPLLTWKQDDIFATQSTDLQSDRTVDVYSAKADYQSIVLGMLMMEAGGKWSMARTNNTENHIEKFNGATILDNTNQFDYTEHIGAMYATLAGMIPGGFTAKIGLRGEYTHAFNSIGSVTQDYFDLFPSVFVGYNTRDMMKRFGLSYTRRIQRPNYSQLNPFQYFIDAHTSMMGNPDLRPAYSNDLSLTAGFGQYVTLMGYFSYSKDVIGFNPELDPATGAQRLYADNIGKNVIAGGSVTLSDLPLGKFFSLMLSAQLFDFHSTTNSTMLLAGIPSSLEASDVHSLLFSGYACITLMLPKDWKLQLDGFVVSPVTQGYMRNNWNYLANFAIKKSALDGRLLFTLSLNDIFRTRKNSFGISMNGTQVTYYDQHHLEQTVKIGLQWNFGTAQKPLKRRKVGTLDEASRTANSTSVQQ